MEGVGKKIKKLREFYGITQKNLGEFLGYSEAHISYIESGDRPVNYGDLKKMANLFKVSVDMFSTTLNFSNNHFRASKTEDGDELVNEKVMEDFIEFAKKQK